MSTATKEQGEERVHPNRGRPRDEDARKRILNAALEMLEEFGFANTTADRIAERAGTGKATLYKWWPNKTAVMIEALREAVAQELPLPDTGELYEDIRLQLRNFVKLQWPTRPHIQSVPDCGAERPRVRRNVSNALA